MTDTKKRPGVLSRTGTSALLVAAFAVSTPAGSALAQQDSKLPKVGYLAAGSRKAFAPRLAAFRKGLLEKSYREQRTILIEERYAEGQRERLPALAAELVALGVDVIVTNGATATKLADKAAKEAGRAVPVVFAIAADPVGTGLVASLARPGGNTTGLTNATSVLVAKRLALLKEVLPSASRVAVLWSPRARSLPSQLNTLTDTGLALGVTIIPISIANAGDLDRAFAEIRAARPDALNVLGWSLVDALRKRIADQAVENDLPTMFTSPRAVSAGGLMSYGADVTHLYRRAATYVDKILKGAKPSELPVERPTKFALVVNLKTAKKLGIALPRSILLRADKVIE